MGLFRSINFTAIYTPRDISHLVLPTPDYDDAWTAQQSLSKSWSAARDTPGYMQTNYTGGHWDIYNPDRAVNIEFFYPGDVFAVGSLRDDNLIGNRGDDNINGSVGNDFVHGGAGHDNVVGGLGNDKLFGGAGDDEVSGDQGYWFHENPDSAADGNDYLNGGSGNDTLFGGGGKDTLIGGTGQDTASYIYSSAIDASLLRGDSFDTYHTTDDRLESIENLTGSGFSDRLEGNAASNILHGGDGYDSLIGDDGDDFLFADKDGGHLTGGNGNDKLVSGSGSNHLYGNLGDDIFTITEGDCFVFGGQGFDSVEVIGSADNWQLTYVDTVFDGATNEYESHFTLTSLDGTLPQPIYMAGVENINFSDGTSILI